MGGLRLWRSRGLAEAQLSYLVMTSTLAYKQGGFNHCEWIIILTFDFYSIKIPSPELKQQRRKQNKRPAACYHHIIKSPNSKPSTVGSYLSEFPTLNQNDKTTNKTITTSMRGPHSMSAILGCRECGRSVHIQC